jgi:non-ribosomal peptide synthetase-like protein
MFIDGPCRPDLIRAETLADLLEATALRMPQQTALREGQQSLSYAELDAAADRVAATLIGLGAQPGRLIGLWAPRGLALLVLQAGIAKSGAGFMPFDADTPLERIATCLADADALGLVVDATFHGAAAGLPLPVWSPPIDPRPLTAPLPRRLGLTPAHTAYVIYTSGSTGKPKGIAVYQGAIAHFLRSENAVLGVRSDDLVYQGFSVAFDMSFEEIWISYLVGATLWIAPKALVADPDALVAALARERISVLHAVPTLLSLFPHDVPTLRLINLGGEACPDSVVARFATPDRELFNTYGPTEATVSASLARLVRGEPVTIGTPLPNYGLWVRSEAGEALPAGEVGELCITGPGVAQGYLGRPELTAEKFIEVDGRRCYRTGDLARIDANGQVHCLGRVDDQVKVRGFRVELGEIEAALCACPGVATAAVVLVTVAEVEQLVAYLASDSVLPDTATLRSRLGARLPPYMVPALFVPLAHMPRLLSGKIDRKALKALPVALAPASEGGEEDTTHNPALAAVIAAAKPLFGGRALRGSDDFFDTLGGHSLLAARLVSRLRAQPAWASASVQQVYGHRTLAGIAAALQAGALVPPSAAPAVAALPPRWRRYTCGAAQLLVLPPLVALKMFMWLSPFLAYHFLTGDEGDSVAFAMLAALGVYLLANLGAFGVAIAGKWLVAGRLRPGRYPLWGVTFFRFWLAERLAELPARHLLSSSPLHVWYLRALGARIGAHANIAAISLRAPDLLRVGAGATIGSSVNLENARVLGGELVLGRIDIGAEAYVGSYCALEADTAVGDGARLDGLSSLAQGQRVPAGELWLGSPARKVANVDPDRLPPRPTAGPGQPALELTLHGLGAAFVLMLFFMPVFPGFMLIDQLDTQAWMQEATDWLDPAGDFALYTLLSIPAAAVMILATVLLSAALRWWVLPRLRPGRFSLHSWVWHRKWLTNQIQEASLAVLHGLYATVYSPWWYRILGAKVGKGAEISTALGVVPDMLTLGDDTFIADGVMLGDEEIDRGWVSVQPTVIGDRSFVGNGAFVPDGTRIPENVLVAVQSRAPHNADMRAGDTWMGSPPMRLPAREPVAGFAEALTFRPSPQRRLGRAAIELLRVVLPLALIIASGYTIVRAVLPDAVAGDWPRVLAELGLAGLAYGIGCYALVLLLKWLLIGRYRPRAVPMWTLFVWTSEAITNLYESIAVPNFVSFLRGTPWLPAALRMLGARIGRDVYLDTTDLTEFDCVHIGPGSVLNAWCGPQTHLFEDRVMKIGEVRIGSRVNLGTRCTVLYGAEVGDGVQLGPLTLVSKGETLPAGTHWHGVPASPA